MVAQIEGVIWNGSQWIRVEGQEILLENGEGMSRRYMVGKNRSIDSSMPIGINFIKTSRKNTMVTVSRDFRVETDPSGIISRTDNKARLMNGQTAVFREKPEKDVGITGVRIHQRSR